MRQIRKKYIFNTWKFILLFIPLFFSFVTSGYAIDVTLAWDANTDPDLDGYWLYYKTGPLSSPYNGMGATEGDSPIYISLQEIYNPEQPEYTIHGLDEAETYYFVLTAYDINGRESGYSNEVGFNNGRESGSSNEVGFNEVGLEAYVGGCFIATAAYGSPMEPHVNILSEFRDRFLLVNAVGKGFVRLYNTYSPSIADCIAKYDSLRAMVRVSLLPVVGMSWVALNLGFVSTMALMLLFCMGIFGLFRVRRKFIS